VVRAGARLPARMNRAGPRRIGRRDLGRRVNAVRGKGHIRRERRVGARKVMIDQAPLEG
jgi:hypothetical protein